MKTYLLIILFSVSSTIILAQQKTVGKFIITDAKANNIDVTEMYLENEGYIAFYTYGDGTLNMTNMMSKKSNSQSYGRLYAISNNSSEETESKFKTDIVSFKWRYKNTYDSKSGTATVRFQKIYKPQGITFVCTMIPENLDVLIFKGYMEGSLDFSDYIK